MHLSYLRPAFLAEEVVGRAWIVDVEDREHFFVEGVLLSSELAQEADDCELPDGVKCATSQPEPLDGPRNWAYPRARWPSESLKYREAPPVTRQR